MCGRYVSPAEAAMERYWQLGAGSAGRWIRPLYNVAPSMSVPMVILGESGRAEVLPARWGLVPGWWKKPSLPSLTFNARSEEAAIKPMWRHSYRAQRCLMPALGWYEWNARQMLPGPGGRPVKQAYYIHAEDDALLAFAGLWSIWQGPDGRELLSCALLTREALPSISAIHARMPVVLAAEQFESWLSPELSTQEVGELLADAGPAVIGYPVSTEVNSTRNDYPELLQPLTP